MLAASHFETALPYAEFLAKYGTDADRSRWQSSRNSLGLSAEQIELLKSFTRRMNVLVLAGAWCGDCSSNVPMFELFAGVAPKLNLRYLDRDDNPDVSAELQVNGGQRVPVVVFFSEDGHEVGRYGERTLTDYRRLASAAVPSLKATLKAASPEDHRAAVLADWLREFERAQWILRLSPRLRRLHGD